jgi:hypothetical protein
MNGFRISNNAASLATDGSSSSVFLAPHSGYRISLYDGTNWQNVTLASPPSTGLVGQTAGIPCDVFVVYGSLTTATLELTAWTNATTRAAAIAQQNGVWVKTGFKRYVGTILPDSATTYSHVSSASGASSPVCGIWNQDNRICGQFTWLPTFLSWTTPTANTWLQLNAQAAAKVQYVQGQSVDIVSAEHIGAASGTAGAALGIGIDSTTTPSGLRDQTANTGIGPLRAQIKQLIAAGAHSLSALARGGATSVIFYGGDVPMQGGLTAELWY